MKQTVAIIGLGFVLGIAGYAGLYHARIAREQAGMEMTKPELAWLKDEFGLNEQEFQRISELHEQYLPECAKMCAKIAAVNSELEKLVLQTNQVTPQISARLAEIGRLRQECQTTMLTHFYAVSRAMPSDQGRRYLARMQKLTSLSNVRDHSLSDHHASAHERHPELAPEDHGH